MMTTSDYNTAMSNNAIAVMLNVVAVVVSSQEQIEHWLRITSLVVGIIAGILAIVSTVQKMVMRRRARFKR